MISPNLEKIYTELESPKLSACILPLANLHDLRAEDAIPLIKKVLADVFILGLKKA